MSIDQRKTLSGAHDKAESALAKIEAHEDVCAERYKAIAEGMGDLKTAVKSHQKIAWGIMVALVGWMAVQLWTGQQERIANLERPISIGVGP